MSLDGALSPSLHVGTSRAICPRPKRCCPRVASRAWCREQLATSNTIWANPALEQGL